MSDELGRPVLARLVDGERALGDDDRADPGDGDMKCPQPRACWGEEVCLILEGGGELCEEETVTGNVQHLASIEDGVPVALCGADLLALEEDGERAPGETCPECAEIYARMIDG